MKVVWYTYGKDLGSKVKLAMKNTSKVHLKTLKSCSGLMKNSIVIGIQL